MTGPLGPRFKHLGRRKLCQGRYTDPCVIREWLPSENSLDEIWEAERAGDGEDWKGDERDPPSLGDGNEIMS